MISKMIRRSKTTGAAPMIWIKTGRSETSRTASVILKTMGSSSIRNKIRSLTSVTTSGKSCKTSTASIVNRFGLR